MLSFRKKRYRKNKTKKKKYSKINIIFDLDNTLIHSFEDNYQEELLSYTNYEEKYYFTTDKKNYIIYTRPYTKNMLKYCFNNCNVGFWTAGNTEYCNLVVNYILTQKQKKKSMFILARESSDKKYTTFRDLISKNIFKSNKKDNKITKPIKILYERFNIYPENTVIIDNNPLVYKINKYNSIIIDNYFYNLHKKDISLLKIVYWINIIKNKYKDIRYIEKPKFNIA